MLGYSICWQAPNDHDPGTRSGADRGSRHRQPHPLRPGRRRRLRPCQRPPRQAARAFPAGAQHGAGPGHGGRHHGVRPTASRSTRRAARPISNASSTARSTRPSPEVMAVVHTHSPAVIPFGVVEATLRPIYHMSSFLGAGVPVFEIRDAGGPATDMLIATRRSAPRWRNRSGSRRRAVARPRQRGGRRLDRGGGVSRGLHRGQRPAGNRCAAPRQGQGDLPQRRARRRRRPRPTGRRSAAPGICGRRKALGSAH